MLSSIICIILHVNQNFRSSSGLVAGYASKVQLHPLLLTVHTIIIYEILFHVYPWIGMLLYSYWAMTSGRRWWGVHCGVQPLWGS